MRADPKSEITWTSYLYACLDTLKLINLKTMQATYRFLVDNEEGILTYQSLKTTLLRRGIQNMYSET